MIDFFYLGLAACRITWQPSPFFLSLWVSFASAGIFSLKQQKPV